MPETISRDVAPLANPMADTSSTAADRTPLAPPARPDDAALETLSVAALVAEAEHAITESPPQATDTLALYLRELSRYPVLSVAQERRLGTLAFGGDEAAQDALVRHNLRFSVALAQRYVSSGVALADLIQEGNVGLMRAARRFDPTRGVRFISYAAYWIHQAIRYALASQQRAIRVPPHRAAQLAHLERVQRQEEAPFAAGDDTLAARLGVSRSVLTALRRAARSSMSLDAVQPGTVGTLGDRLGVAPDGELRAERACRDASIRAALAELPPRDAQVVRLSYGLDGSRPLTLEEIGHCLGVTRERVRQLRERALQRLRQSAGAKRLADYVAADLDPAE